MKKLVFFLTIGLSLSCSNDEVCGTVLERRETINPYLIQIKFESDNGTISNIITSKTSLQVGDYTCFD